MKLRSFLLALLDSGSLTLGGGLIYARRVRALMRRIVCLSLRRLGDESGDGQVSASEVYFFIWAVEKVARRQNLQFPTFNFSARKGMLASSRLTYILRRMIADGWLAIDGNYLIPDFQYEPQLPNRAQEEQLLKIRVIIDEVADQWNEEASDNQLVRFGKLFR
ncbi:MAG TPA: hypothetical protein VM123_07610 [archaeon]|nr:hypothetical protein [archaeon]